MVARITSGATPVEALYYNKDKIGRGEGRFLAAFNTPMQVTDERYFDIPLPFDEKLPPLNYRAFKPLLCARDVANNPQHS